MWKINDVDITSRFGAYLKRGSYDSLMLYPRMKEYVTEDVREEDGERVHVDMKNVKARTITLSFYIVSDKGSFNKNYESFLRFLIDESTFCLYLVKQNRQFRLRYEGGVSRREIMMKGDTYYCEVSIEFRQDNPFDVTESNFIIHENREEEIVTEQGIEIGSFINVYKN